VLPPQINVADPKPAPVESKPVAPEVKVRYALTTATDLAILKGLPSGSVEVYPVGTQWAFKGAVLALPVSITVTNGVEDVKGLK